MEEKQTHLCRKCTCITSIHAGTMNRTIVDLDIRMAATTYDMEDYDQVVTVVEVKNGSVCAQLCIDKVVKDGQSDIDSWHYVKAGNNRTCVCSSFRNCYNKSRFTHIDNYEVDLELSLQPFVMGKHLLSCSKEDNRS